MQVMRHLREVDGADHTVLMVQVENESGNVGGVRDFSPEANALFAKAVPAPADDVTTVRVKVGRF